MNIDTGSSKQRDAVTEKSGVPQTSKMIRVGGRTHALARALALVSDMTIGNIVAWALISYQESLEEHKREQVKSVVSALGGEESPNGDIAGDKNGDSKSDGVPGTERPR
jgi:hypothetical protein